MSIKVNKDKIILRDELNSLKLETGSKGRAILRADTAEDARNLVGDHVDIYKEVADNDTFVIPANTIQLKLFFDVLTEQASTAIRIGTADGGEQVVADVVTTAAGTLTATMVIENFKAGDTLYIGSDGDAAWVALDITMHAYYKVLDVS